MNYMDEFKKQLESTICFTPLVYERVNKKLNLACTDAEIEALVLMIIQDTPVSNYIKEGKNVYISNEESDIRLTINTFTNRIITADKLSSIP